VARTFTGTHYALWIKEMGMETLRLTPLADRKYTWDSVIHDIERFVTRYPELDEFRGNRKRTAAQAGLAETTDVGEPWIDTKRADRKRLPIQPDHPATRTRGAGNQGRWNKAIDRESHQEDVRRAQNKWLPKTVHFEAGDHYGPADVSALRKDVEDAAHCWRCWATDHWASDCIAGRCTKCTAPIKGGVHHNARICSAPRSSGRGRGRGDARTGRGSRNGRGGRGN